MHMYINTLYILTLLDLVVSTYIHIAFISSKISNNIYLLFFCECIILIASFYSFILFSLFIFAFQYTLLG